MRREAAEPMARDDRDVARERTGGGAEARAWPVLTLVAFTVAGPFAGAALVLATHDSWYPALAASDVSWLFVLCAGVGLCALSLLPTHAVSLVAGMLFGGVWGGAVALLTIGVAAILGFVILRPLVGPRVLAWVARRPRAEVVRRAVLEEGASLGPAMRIALVRLSPVMPFAMTNLLLAGLGARFRDFAFGAAVGLASRIVVVAVAGEGMRELDLSAGRGRALLLAGIAATLLLLYVLARVAKRALDRAAPPS